MTTTHLDEVRADGRHLVLGWSSDPPFGTVDGWTPAHAEAARFIGGCFAFGALCGVVVEMARPGRGRGHG